MYISIYCCCIIWCLNELLRLCCPYTLAQAFWVIGTSWRAYAMCLSLKAGTLVRNQLWALQLFTNMNNFEKHGLSDWVHQSPLLFSISQWTPNRRAFERSLHYRQSQWPGLGWEQLETWYWFHILLGNWVQFGRVKAEFGSPSWFPDLSRWVVQSILNVRWTSIGYMHDTGATFSF